MHTDTDNGKLLYPNTHSYNLNTQERILVHISMKVYPVSYYMNYKK